MVEHNNPDKPVEFASDRWSSRQLNYLSEINPDSVTGVFEENDEIEYVEISSVTDRGAVENTKVVPFGDAPSRAKRLVQPGDVIVSTVRTYLKAIALIREPPSNLVVSSGFAVIRPCDEIIPEFLWYVLQSKPYVEWIMANSEGVSYPAISASKLSKVIIPIPPLEVQKQICEYIRHHVLKIDELIQTADNLRSVLTDKQKTLIRDATTSGLDDDVDAYESEVGWIGEIPQHWNVVRTRFVARLESGHTPSRSNEEYWENTYIPWVTTSDIEPFRKGQKIYLHDTEHKISELGLENSGARLLPEKTVFLSRTASVGFSGIMGCEMATSQDFANWVCGDEIIPEYLLYVFRSMNQEFDRLTQGSTHQTIYMPDIRSFKTPLPPLEEQREIIEYIQNETNQLWELIDKIEKTIELLKEKRTALISNAVTGQAVIKQSNIPEDKDRGLRA